MVPMMQMKDRLQLQTWLRSNASFDEVMRTSRFGLVENERFTEKARRHFYFLWLWSAPRNDEIHDIVYDIFGADFYWRRIEKVKRIVEELKK